MPPATTHGCILKRPTDGPPLTRPQPLHVKNEHIIFDPEKNLESSKVVSSHEARPDRDNRSILIIDWDGPSDPENPRNWSLKQKWSMTAIFSAFSFITSVSSSMIAPATDQVAVQFGLVSGGMLAAFTTSAFVLAIAAGPLFLAPLSEIYGRSRVIVLANLWYLVWNLGCGFARNERQLLTFRFLSGLGGSASFALGGGVLGDCWLTEERGQAAALYFLAPLLGPVIGPMTGAWISECSTWRWVFWSTSIVDAIIQLVAFFFIRETYAPVILERKAVEIKRSMDLEKFPCREVRTVFDTGEGRSWKAFMIKSLVRPFALYFQEPILQLLGVYLAYLFGTLYLFLTTIPLIFEGAYQEPVGISGLHYIALGLGLSGASQLNARTMDKVYTHCKNKNGGIGRPEFKLPAMFVSTIALPIGLLVTGWSVELHVHWVVADIGIALVGMGVAVSMQCIQAYVIDAFTLYAASAMAAVLFLRSLSACGFPLFAPGLYAALGFGKGDTVLAVAAVVIGCPAPWIFWYFGEKLRKASRYAH